MTAHEALVLGIVWGGLAHANLEGLGYTLETPDPHGAPLLVLRGRDGRELLVSVTESRRRDA